MDLEIRRLKEKLISTLNESEIPIEVKRYVLADVYRAVEQKANEIVDQEFLAEQAETEQKKEES